MSLGLKITRLLSISVIALIVSIGLFAQVQAEEKGTSQQNGLKAEFYTSSEPGAFDFAEKKATIVSPAINYANLNPLFSVLTGQDNDVTARWTGKIEPEFSEDYRFSMIGDNGFRLWIDGQLVIDHWVNDWDNEQLSEAISLEAGKKYDIKVEYFEDHGGAYLNLHWMSESQEKEIVPENRLYLPDDFDFDGPVYSTVSENGKTIELGFEDSIEDIPEDAAEHFSVVGNKQPVSIKQKEGDASTVILELEYPITSKDEEYILLAYDGEGEITKKDGSLLSEFGTMATNNSNYIISSVWAEELKDDVKEGVVLPEYPRPQMEREDWVNLNGEWEFQGASEEDNLPAGQVLKEKIVVPFAVESKLSGIERHEDHMWYKRDFTIPENWSGDDVLLHFGAVDWEATVYVNGKEVGSHKGGYDAFEFNITDHLQEGENELIVEVKDDTSTSRPLGKQRLNPEGIFYTSVSGIWQTVWLEPVSPSHIEGLKMTPEIHEEYLGLTVEGAKGTSEVVEAVAYKDGEEVGRATGTVGEEMQIPVPDPRLWSTTDPFLYDLEVRLKDREQTLDKVSSYFGMREITLGKVDGTLRPLLNGEFVFQMGPLDQGYWPAGLYTAPTDEALKFDIEQAKELGFNMIRKHGKVEPQRFHYWADKMGMLVWQDMPSMYDNNPTEEDAQQFEHEFEEMIEEHYNSPSLIVWTVFNEGWGQYDTERITKWVEEKDPTRLVSNASGWTDMGVGDMIDFHCYADPCSPEPTEDRIAVLGEYGGLGLHVPGHEWNSQVFNYEMQESKEQLTDRYLGMISDIKNFKEDSGLSAAVYTQITDVEMEINGLLSYDRKVEKIDFEKVKKAHRDLIGTVQHEDLIEKIAEAQELLDNAEAGDEPGEYQEEYIEAFAAAIQEADGMAQKDGVTQEEIRLALKELQEAITVFKDQVNPPIPLGAVVDHFDNEQLDDGWNIYKESEEKRWSLTEIAGKLRLHTLPGDSYQDQNELQNVFLRNAPSENVEITTKVTAPLGQNHQQAGLFIWQDEDNYVRFGHVWDTIANNGYSLETAKEEDGVYSKAENMTDHPGTDTMYLKIKKQGNLFTTYYWNGEDWIQASDPIETSLEDIQIGFYGTSTFAEDIYADFDYVTIKPLVTIELLEDRIEDYMEEGTLKHPLSKKLKNTLKQAQHHMDKGKKKQAFKKMNDFLKHLNNKGMDKFITGEAKNVLDAEAALLIDSWK